MGKQRDLHDITDLRVALYCRVSFDKTGLERSVDDQESIGRGWVESRGGRLVEDHVYRDNSVSASVFARKPRKEFLRLRSGVDTGGIDVLWFWSLSRAARDQLVFTEFLRLCEDRGVVWSVNGTMYDPSNGNHVLTLQIMAAVAERESKEISDNVTRSHKSAAAAGRHSNRIPYGYTRRYDPVTRRGGELEPDTDADRVEDSPAAVVAEIFTAVARGRSLRRVANDLNNRGVPAPSSRYWDATKLRHIATRPTYIKLRVYKGEPLRDADGDYVLGGWPALVDEDVYWQVQRILQADRGTWPVAQSERGTALSLLTFIARCGVCGNRLHTVSSRTAYGCVSGSHVGVSCDRLDTVVTEAALEVLTDPEQYEQWSNVDDSADVVAARAAADSARVELGEWMAKAGGGDITPSMAAQAEKRLLARIDEAETTIRDASVPPVLRGHAGPHARETWASLELDARRQLVRALFDVEVLPVGRGSRTPIEDRVRLTRLTGDDPRPVLPPAPLDWPTREDRERRFEERHQRAAELHAQGKTWVEIGAEMGVTPTMARRYALRLRASDHDTTLGEIRSRAADRRAQVVKLRAEGMTLRAIATELGVSYGCVRLDVQKAREEGETVQ